MTPAQPAAPQGEDVRVGQVWEDNDWRSANRPHLRVVAVDDTHATVIAGERGRKTRIRLDRFRPTSTGYRLVMDTEPTP